MSTTTLTTPRLSEVARHLVIPGGIKKSVFPRVYRRLNEVGVEFDPWQRGFGTAAFGCRADGKYAASIGGVVASIPRQVGKTFTVGNLLIGLALEFPGMRIAWTSHHNRTTTNTFRSMQGMVKRKAIAPHLAVGGGIRTANGEQEIVFRNGSIIMFGAREQGFGRGLDEIDVEVFDEAQILTLKALEDMVPATNQARNPHGGLLFFLGTPPRPTDPGEAFTSKRTQAIEKKSTNIMYVEISAEADTDPDDYSKIHTYNPSYPHRTPLESIQRMRENIPDDDSYRREAMGIWPLQGQAVFDMNQWSALMNTDAAAPPRVVLAVAVAQDRRWSCIGAAGDGGGATLVMCHSIRGLSGVAGKVLELQAGGDVVEVTLVGAQAKALEPNFVRAGIEYAVLTGGETGAACAAFQVGVEDSTVIHVGQGELDVAVANAQTRRVGESEQWDRRDAKVDDSPLVAVSSAFYRWGLTKESYDVLESVW